MLPCTQLSSGHSTFPFVLCSQVCAAEGSPVVWARAWSHSIGAPYFCFSTPMSQEIPLDMIDDVQLVSLLWEMVEYVQQKRAELEQLIDLLRTL